MRPGLKQRVTFTLLAAALVFYFVLAGERGWILIRDGRPLTVLFGVAVLVMPILGAWFLWRTIRFGLRSQQLARQLEHEGGLPVDELRRSASGRVVRDSADAVFVRRKAEAEAAPDEWRAWFRLAIAYSDARDTPRARRAMQHAIRLHAQHDVSSTARAQH